MRRRKDLPAPAEPAPEQGAPTVTVSLRNPQALLAELDAEAAQSEAMARQNTETANRLRGEADDHGRQAGEAAAEEMRLATALSEAKQRRELHEHHKQAKLAEAAKHEEQAQNFDDRAADRKAAIEVVKMALANGNGQAIPPDPTADTRTDEALARIDAARAQLPAKHREEETVL